MEKKTAVLPGVNPYAAGIDIGSRTHWVAVDQKKENVQSFGVYTQDHQQLIDHLRQHQITSVAMESTGTYWQTLFNSLQQAGFEPGRFLWFMQVVTHNFCHIFHPVPLPRTRDG